MKVVLDTNVLIAAFATRGLCEAVLQVCLDSHEIILSEYILKELRRGLTDKLRIPVDRAHEIVAFMHSHATFVEPAHVEPEICSDSTDLPVLGTAVAAQADCLVTGDRELLRVREIRNIPILAPREFYRTLHPD